MQQNRDSPWRRSSTYSQCVGKEEISQRHNQEDKENSEDHLLYKSGEMRTSSPLLNMVVVQSFW